MKTEYETKVMYDTPAQSRRQRQQDLAKEIQAQLRQDPLNHGNMTEAQALNVLHVRWRDAKRNELLSMCDDGGGRGSYLWQQYASKQPNIWAQLHRLKELLVGSRLLSRADANSVSIDWEPPTLSSDELEVK